MLAKDRKAMAIYDQSADKRAAAENIFTARYECRRYQLLPQQPEETDADFCERVRVEKTPGVVAENMRKLIHLEALQTQVPTIPQIKAREPGSDDELTTKPERS
jgi:hypothetical protein